MGLDEFPSPILGVTVGMVVAVIAYGLLLIVRRDQWVGTPIIRELMGWQVLAGVLVGVSTWARWMALDLAPVGTVLALGRLNVPVVLVLSVFMLDRKHERITARVWLGGAFIVAGSLLLTYFR